jgi:hypothetical protein
VLVDRDRPLREAAGDDLAELGALGGPVSMIVRRARMSSSVGSSNEIPRPEENLATSRLTVTMS